MSTAAEIRERYPDVFGDMSDFDLVDAMSQEMGMSRAYTAWKLGLPSEDYAQNESNGQDFGTDLAVGGAEALRGVAGVANIAAAPFTDQQLITTPGLDEYIQRQQSNMSPNRQRAQGELDQAWEDGGFWNILGEYASEPAYLTGMGLQSAPAMVGGGVGGMALRGAARLGAGAMARGLGAAAPYIGEGAIAGGMDYAQMVEQGVDPQVAAGYGALAGAGVGALGGVGGAFANRMGITDVSRALSGARRVDGDVPLSYGRQLGYGSLNEAGQEILQSPWEQAMQNLATDQPVTEGLARSAVEGGILGGVMGAGFNAIPRGRELDLTQDREDTQGLTSPPGVNPPGSRTPNVDPLAAARQRQIDAMMGGDTNQTVLPGQEDPANLQGLSRSQVNQRLIDAAMAGETARTYAPGQYPSDVAAALTPAVKAPATANIPAPAKPGAPEDPAVEAFRKLYTDNPTWPNARLFKSDGALYKGYTDQLAALRKGIGQLPPQDAITVINGRLKNLQTSTATNAGHLARLFSVVKAEQEAKLSAKGQTTNPKADTAGTVPEPVAQAPQPQTASVVPPQGVAPEPAVAPTTGTSLADLAERGKARVAPGGKPVDLTQDPRPVEDAPAAPPPTPQEPKQTSQKLVINEDDADHPARFEAVLNQVATKRSIPEQARPVLADLMQRYFRIGKYHEYSGVQPPSYTSMAAALNASGYAVSHTTAGQIAKEVQDRYAAELGRQGKPIEYFDPQAMTWTGTLDDGNQRGTRSLDSTAEEFNAEQDYGRGELVDAAPTKGEFGDITSEKDEAQAAGNDDLGQFDATRGADGPVNAFGTDDTTEADATDDAGIDDAGIDEELGYQLGGIGSKADAAAGGIGGADAVSARPRAVKFFTDRHLFAVNKYRQALGADAITLEEAKAELRKLSDVVLARYFDRIKAARISGKRLADANDPKPKLVEAYQALLDDLTALGTGALRGDKSGRTVVELETPDTGGAVPGAIVAWQQATRDMPNAPALGALPAKLANLWEEAHNTALGLPDFRRGPLLRTFARELINEQNTQSKRGDVAGTAAQPQASGPAGTAARPDNAERAPEGGSAQPELATGGSEAQAPDVVIGNKDASGVVVRSKKRRVVQPGVSDSPTRQQGQAPKPEAATTGVKLRQVVRGLLGTDEHWRVNIYETAQEAAAAGQDVPETAYGWVDVDRKGVKHAYFIAERIQAGTELGKFLHEVGAHIGIENILDGKQLTQLYGRIEQWAKATDGSVESKAAKLAMARVAESGVTELDDQRSEGIAYFLEELVNAGVDPTTLNTSTALGRWFRTLWAAFKAALRKLRVQNIDRLTGQDVVDLAYGAARLDLNTRWHGKTAPGKRQFGIAGPKARNADIAGLDFAKAMGGPKHSKDVYELTGWYLDADGMWKWEYSDKNAKMSPDFMKSAKAHTTPVLLEQALTHPELKKAYPDLMRDVKVGWVPSGDPRISGSTGAYYADSNTILLNSDHLKDDPEQALSTVLHEIQHGIQEIEDFGRGANYDAPYLGIGDKEMGRVMRRYRDVGKGFLSHVTSIARLLGDYKTARPLRHFAHMPMDAREALLRDSSIDPTKYFAPDLLRVGSDNELRQLISHMSQSAAAAGAMQKVFAQYDLNDGAAATEAFADLFTHKRRSVRQHVQEAFYSESQGEVEARNVQGRMHMTAAERQALPPNASADVPAERRIIKRAGTGSNSVSSRQFGQETPAARERRGADITVPPIDAANQWIQQEFKSGKTLGEHTTLGWLTMEQIAERYGAQVPALRAINTAIGTMEAMAKKWVGKAEHIDRLWQQLSKAQDKLLSETMIAASLAGYDPDVGKTKGVKTAEEVALDRQWQHLQALDKGAKVPAVSIYRAVRNHFEQDLAEVKAHLKALKGKERTPQVDALIGALEGLSKGSQKPYFPLMRLGGYYTVGRSPELQALHDKRGANDDGLSDVEEKRYEALRKDGKHYVVSSHSRLANAERHRDKLIAQGMTAFANTAQERGAKHRSSIVEDMKTFDNAIKDLNLDAGVKKQLEQVYEGLLISSLPEGHVLKKNLRRDGIIGADTDMRRVVATSANSRAYALSRLRHARDVQEALGELRAASADGNNTERALANELVRRTNLAYEHYQDSPIITAMTTASYMGMLGASPAFWLINLTQVPLITAPWLAARTDKSFTATLKDLGAAAKQASSMIKWTTDGQWRAEFNLDNPPKGVTADEIRMFRDLEDAGQLDFTLAFDLGQVAAGKSGKFWNALRSLNAPTNATELINRGGTALASYRAKRGQGASHEAAVDFAKQATNTTQINYNPANAARHMQSVFGSRGLAKLMFQFWTYQQGMTYLALSTLKDAAAGDKTARKTMAYMTGTLVATAGIFGLPFASMLLSAASWVLSKLGDDDEPVDLEVGIKNLLHDLMPGIDTLLTKGAPGALLGVDLSARTGQGNLMNPLAYARFGAKDTGTDTIQELMFRIFGGASAGTAASVVDGVTAIADGDLLKGVEKIGPLKAVKDLAKFAQLQGEGVKTGSGEQALGPDVFHAGNLLAQAMGFSPTKKSLYYESNAAVQNVKQAVDGVRTKLLSRYAQAFIAGKGFTEVHKEIQAFNQRHPERRISWTNMTQSVKQRRTNRQERLSSGVAGGKDNQAFQQYGRFAQ